MDNFHGHAFEIMNQEFKILYKDGINHHGSECGHDL